VTVVCRRDRRHHLGVYTGVVVTGKAAFWLHAFSHDILPRIHAERGSGAAGFVFRFNPHHSEHC
jgi:hypothetical protein